MSPELDQQLFDKFGKYFPQYENEFNFEIFDGWYYLIYYLLEGMTRQLRYAEKNLINTENSFNDGKKIHFFNKETNSPDSRPYTKKEVGDAQVKYNEALSKIPHIEQIKEKYGTLRIYVSNSNPEIESLISYAEGMSQHTCQECGNIGKLRGTNWLRVLCNTHAELLGYTKPLDQ
jgi:hypothetical protein